MKSNPPCYRCTVTTPLQAGVIGLCPACAAEVEAERTRPSSQPICPRCSHPFYNDWERIQHLVNQRHNYLAWTDEDGERAAEKNAGRVA